MGHVLGENRHGPILGVTAAEASGAAEREAALRPLTRAKHRLRPKALGADKGNDAGPFYRELERRQVAPHVPVVKPPRDPRAVPRKDQVPDIRARRRMRARVGTAEYELSQRCRKRRGVAHNTLARRSIPAVSPDGGCTFWFTRPLTP